MDVWETEYHHGMDSPEAIVDWISSTGLRPFLEVLDPPERREFVSRLSRRVVSRTRSQFIAEAVVYDAAGREVSRGSGTFVRGRALLQEVQGYQR